jgi:O-antigen ligase
LPVLRSDPVTLRRTSIWALALTAAAMPYSTLLCHWSYVAFIFCWILQGEWKQKLMLAKSNPVMVLFPLLFLANAWGAIYTSNMASAWMHLEKKGSFLLIPITLASTRPLRREELLFVLRMFVFACFAATLICVGHSFWLMITGAAHQNFGDATINEFIRLNPEAPMTWMNFSYITLASGIGMHPTYLGLYLSLCLMILAHFFHNGMFTGVHRVLALGVYAWFLVFILFLSSRIAIIVSILVSLSALTMHKNLPSTRFVLRAVALMILVGAVMYFNPVTRFRGFQEPSTASLENIAARSTTSIEIRLALLKLSSAASGHVNPWLGNGTGSGEDFLRGAGAERGISNILNSYDPHNQFIYTFFELGGVGLTVLIAVFFFTAYLALKRKSYLLTALTLSFITVCMTESALELQRGIIFFTFFSSLLLFHEDQAKAAAT